MWWAGSKALDVYVGSRAVAVCDAHALQVKQRVESFDEAMKALEAWSQRAKPERVNVWLSGGLCRPLLMQPVPGLKGEAEWRQAATALVGPQLGIDEPCEIWVEKAPADQARVVAAVRSAAVQAVEAWARAERIRLVTLAPWWSEALRAALQAQKDATAVTVQDCDSLTLFTGREGRFGSATVYTPVCDEATARATRARALMGADVQAARQVGFMLSLDGVAEPRDDLAMGLMAELHA